MLQTTMSVAHNGDCREQSTNLQAVEGEEEILEDHSLLVDWEDTKDPGQAEHRGHDTDGLDHRPENVENEIAWWACMWCMM